jgi:Protein of unknown function (DUF2795)
MTERGSTHHSPRVDDELAHETVSLTQGTPAEPRADEWRLKEGPGDEEPFPDAQITHADEALPGSLSSDDVERRSLLAVSLRPSAFPATGRTLREVAQAEHADPVVMGWLTRLPDDREFANVQEVWETLGGGAEQRDVVPERPTVPERTAVTERAPVPERNAVPERTAVPERAAPERTAVPQRTSITGPPAPVLAPASSLIGRARQAPALVVRTASQAVGAVRAFGATAWERLSRLRPGSDQSDR